MESTKEKVSYCIGLDIGTGLSNQYAEMDVERLIEGLQDAIHRREPQIQKDEVQNILFNLRNQVELKRREAFAKIGAENRQAGEDFLKQNARKEGIHVLPSGLQYRILSSGSSTGLILPPWIPSKWIIGGHLSMDASLIAPISAANLLSRL